MNHSMKEKATFGKTVAMLITSSVMAFVMVACSSDSYATTVTPKENVMTYTMTGIATSFHYFANNKERVYNATPLKITNLPTEQSCKDEITQWENAVINHKSIDNVPGAVEFGVISFTGFCSKVKSFVFLKP